MSKIHISKKVIIPLRLCFDIFRPYVKIGILSRMLCCLRGVSPSLKSFLKQPSMTIECLYSPLLMAASKAADELAIASVTRGIENPNPRTCLVQICFRIQDFLALVLHFAARWLLIS